MISDLLGLHRITDPTLCVMMDEIDQGDIDDVAFAVFGENPVAVKEAATAKSKAEDLLACLSDGISAKRRHEQASEALDSVKDESEIAEPKVQRIGDATDDMEDLGDLEAIPRMQVHTLDTAEACTHEVCVPHDHEYVPLCPRKGPAAKQYKFVLDPFQKEAILCMDNNQSVLVSAHTSAGKTVVAEYAIAMALRDKQRVIFTSPIKALSNQKYREMFEEFGDVGLMTGDVTINPSASCLVMTTEILRSMLYRGSEIMREVGWVIFDEIHYMRDKDRGVVWEETIILLPDNVHYVFLSATIPNARQFAEWVCFLHKQPCHVVYTDYRPVPLQHYIFPAGGDGLHLVVNENGEFRDENFNTAMKSLGGAGDAGKGEKKGRRGGTAGESSCFKIVKLTMERNLAPVIVFSFSRKDCEAYASQMQKLEFNSAEEKKLVAEVYNNAIDILSDDDKQLPQVKEILPILQRGIGIHHSGLLPLLKETIEILFGEGLIKALFATETFAMGLNMPAKTVMFTSCRKFDGKDFRWLSSGEYIQMSGRAGRRGKDDKGIVILMIDQQMSSEVAKNVIKGKPDPLDSQFRLTYNMVLNLLRVEGINPEFMLERSFFQFQNYAKLPDLYKSVSDAQDILSRAVVPQELAVAGYHKIKQEIAKIEKGIQLIITRPLHIVPFLQPGRLAFIQNSEDTFGWGAVINFRKKTIQDEAEPLYIADVLLNVDVESVGSGSPKPCPKDGKGQMEVVPIVLNTMARISQVRILYPEDLKSLDNRNSVLRTIKEVQKRFPDGLPLLDPIEDMQINDSELKMFLKKLDVLKARLRGHPLHKEPNIKELYDKYLQKLEAEEAYKKARSELKKARSLLQLDELKCRKRVLRRLQYANNQDVINLKGRVACEISAADELILTEMLFDGIFNDLSVQQCAALLSCFVSEENAEMPDMSEELSGLMRKMQDMARRIAKVTAECKLPIDEEKYVEKFKPNLMDVVHEWTSGSTFAKICTMTDAYEGSIIRCMRRLEELLQEMVGAGKAIGNTELEKKFAEAIVRIKRDIVFAASLYL